MNRVQNPGSPKPESREKGMKDASKRATSEVFAQTMAQMMAVTAMIVIASVVFYWR